MPPTECNHTPCPSLYLQWHGWAAEMSKTHRQVQCPNCRLWAVWVPKAHAGPRKGRPPLPEDAVRRGRE